MNTCQTCRHLTSDSFCAFNPMRVAIAEPTTYFCGRWKEHAAVSADIGRAEKITDYDIMEFFEGHIYESRKFYRDNLCAKFGVSPRTVGLHIKRLIKLGLIEVLEPSKEMNIPVASWALRTLEVPAGTGLAGGTTASEQQSRADWTEILNKRRNPTNAQPPKPSAVWAWQDMIPGFNLLAVNAGNPKPFTTLYHAVVQSGSPMGKSAFSRLLKEAVEAGNVVKTEASTYHLK